MSRSASLKAALPAILLLGFGTAALAAPQFLPGDADRVAVFAPRGKGLEVVAAAGGRAFGGSSTAVYAVSNDPDFVHRLYRSGAWLVLRFDGAAGCQPIKLGNTENARG
ncbi:MAG TPA: hypothetical protein PLR41_17900 [Alphaproteobacteria bacterium]|nr:hypothetical protein [Alphaproteobacteria bacterium]